MSKPKFLTGIPITSPCFGLVEVTDIFYSPKSDKFVYEVTNNDDDTFLVEEHELEQP